MTLSKNIRKPEFLNTAAEYELVENFGGSRMGDFFRRFRPISSYELLSRTLSAALASEGTELMGAWLKHFVRTEP